MKILAIRGRNLASLEGSFEINFREEPLKSAGIYAITGATGSGKSTILDAMCIALYDTSPRLENISGSTVIEKKGSKSVSENSSKTILRRGSHEGWAEVEFKAVDGHEYRVRWSVSRTNNSPDGTFRDTSYDLNDITTGEHRKLSAKEHKSVVPALVGLTYEQFTRAVLLAQGNFAAFLKADESEKASILETLSGTGIYSLISAEIYRRYSEAKKELEVIEETMRGISMLGSDELAELQENKKRLQIGEKELEEKKKELNAKREWIKRAELLADELEKAISEGNAAKERLAAAEPSRTRLAMIESVQEIRDSYIALLNKEKGIADESMLVEISGKQLAGEKERLQAAVAGVEAASRKQENASALAISMQPRILEAGTLENTLSLIEKSVTELRNGCTQGYNERNRLLAEIDRCKRAVATFVTEEQEIELWFKENRKFEQALPALPAVIANIVAIGNEELHIKAKSSSLDAAKALNAEQEKQLAKARENEELLKNTMTSEIAALRGRLVDGEPCPVCGSRHHAVSANTGNTLAEKELEKAKEANRVLIEHLTANINASRSEIDKLQSAIEVHSTAIANYHSRNLEYLLGVEDAAALLQRNDADRYLSGLMSQWNSKKERLSFIGNEKRIGANSIELHGKSVETLEKELAAKEQQLEEKIAELENTKRQLATVMDGYASAQKMQEHCNSVVERANAGFAEAVEKRNSVAMECKRLEGLINEKNSRLENDRRLCDTLRTTVHEWLEKRADALGMELLGELAAVDAAAVVSMRKELEVLERNVATATTLIAERERSLKEHKEHLSRPADEETLPMLAAAISGIDEELERLREESSRITALLLKDEENNRNYGEYKLKHTEKKQIANEWNTLNVMFGSQKGDKLMRLVQGYTLDILLKVTNGHLKEIAPRYELMRISRDKLAIKVIDSDVMLSSRSVHSLSGGETFLVSLALSLALSSISSNRMSIETLFIDEGFGALDSETLKTAMRAIEGLQTRGRKIGVISHLSEMLEQIPVKINVVKKGLGRSRVEISDR